MRQQYKFDLYAALSIDKNASQPEIKTAYRKLALLLHPDMSKSSGLEKKLTEEAMCGINEAYGTLSRQDMRQDYDFIVNAGLRLPMPIFYGLIQKLTGKLKPKAQPSQVPDGKKDKTFLEKEIGMTFLRMIRLSAATKAYRSEERAEAEKKISKLNIL